MKFKNLTHYFKNNPGKSIGLLFLLGFSLSIYFIFAQINKFQKPFRLSINSPIMYTKYFSYTSGDAVPIYIYNEEKAKLKIYRLGKAMQLISELDDIMPNIQISKYHPKQGLNWKAKTIISTTGFKSGYYVLEITESYSGKKCQIPLIIKPIVVQKVSLIGSTNTWHAYNSFGEKSNYKDTQTPHIARTLFTLAGKLLNRPTRFTLTFLPYSRPFLVNITNIKDRYHDHLLRSEWETSAFLEKHNIGYGIYSDKDFAFNYDMHKSEIIIFSTHSEYWSIEMMGKLKQYIDNGGMVIFASGNNIYREVEFTENALVVVSQQIPMETTTKLVGTYYTDSGFRTYAGFKVVDSSHWVFSGTGIKNGEIFGKHNQNRHSDGSTRGASGWETDKINQFTDGFKTLAIGTNKVGPAYMVIKETEQGGWVFNASSITFMGAISHDKVMSRIMLNLLGVPVARNALSPSGHSSIHPDPIPGKRLIDGIPQSVSPSLPTTP